VADLFDVIGQRYSCRSFSPQPIPEAILNKVAEAGLYAPSGHNRQPWRLIVVPDPAVVADLDALVLERLRVVAPAEYEAKRAHGGTVFYGAPAVIAIARERNGGRVSADLEVGLVAAYVLLAATALGLASVANGALPLLDEAPEAEGIRARLGVPQGFDLALGILLGHASGDPRAPHVPDPAKVIWAG
jgi:nitroreductase